jgi:hypothetical protein
MQPVVLEAPTPAPPKKSPRILSDHLVLGFDVEWDGREEVADSPLLSAQFAGYSIGEDGKPVMVSAVYEPPGRRFTFQELAEYVARFVREHGISARVVEDGTNLICNVALIAHLAQAEIGMIDHHFRDLVIQPVGGKAHHARLPQVKIGKWIFRIQIVDLFAFFKTGLDDVGESVGLEKIVEGIDRSRLAELKAVNREKYDCYAKRDAEIALLVFSRLRSQVLARWGIDALAKYTLPALAGDIFVRNFLTREPVPSRTLTSIRCRHKEGGYEDHVEYSRVYDGLSDPRRQRRLDCCACYHGGWAEAFVYGFWCEPIEERDIRSLYPSAACLQPLPNAKTKWFRIDNPERGFDDVEGFGWVSFSFPKGTLYPCLIVSAPGSQRMTFPLSGESCCTIAELRRAKEMGAVFHQVRLHAFRPTLAEKEHDVRRYMQEFMAEKKNLTKGTLEYEVVKLIMNGLIGKLAERQRSNLLVQEERLASRRGWEGFGRALATSLPLRDVLRGQLKVGRVFIPEWATLILGRARSLMVDFVSKGALLVSTDSVILPRGTDISCHSLDLLKTVDSDMPIELEADAAIIFRTRLYAELLKRTNLDRLPKGKEIIALDEDWAVVKMARHGVPVNKEDCARAVLASRKAERSVSVGAKKTTLLGAEAAIRAGLPINHPKVEEREPQFTWDHKRILVKSDVNPWRSYTQTEPYTSLGRLEEAERRKLVERERRLRQRRDNTKAVHDQVISLLAERCHSVREIARLTEVSKSTVQRLKDAMKWSEMDEYKRSRRVRPVSVPVDRVLSLTAESCPTPSPDVESTDQTAQESGSGGGIDVSPDPSQNAKTGNGG